MRGKPGPLKAWTCQRGSRPTQPRSQPARSIRCAELHQRLRKTHRRKGDEGDAPEPPGVRESHDVHALYLATVTPVLPYLIQGVGGGQGRLR